MCTLSALHLRQKAEPTPATRPSTARERTHCPLGLSDPRSDFSYVLGTDVTPFDSRHSTMPGKRVNACDVNKSGARSRAAALGTSDSNQGPGKGISRLHLRCRKSAGRRKHDRSPSLHYQHQLLNTKRRKRPNHASHGESTAYSFRLTKNRVFTPPPSITSLFPQQTSPINKSLTTQRANASRNSSSNGYSQSAAAADVEAAPGKMAKKRRRRRSILWELVDSSLDSSGDPKESDGSATDTGAFNSCSKSMRTPPCLQVTIMSLSGKLFEHVIAFLDHASMTRTSELSSSPRSRWYCRWSIALRRRVENLLRCNELRCCSSPSVQLDMLRRRFSSLASNAEVCNLHQSLVDWSRCFMLRRVQRQIIACGHRHSAAVTVGTRLKAFGRSDARTSLTVPMNSPLGHAPRFVSVACGAQHTLGLTASGQVFSWGHDANGYNVLGRPDSDSVGRVRGVSSGMDCTFIVSIAAGGYTSAAVSRSGQLFMWGDNSLGQAAQSTCVCRSPQRVEFPSSHVLVRAVRIAESHTIALTDRGSIYGWGSNAHGRLGIGKMPAQCQGTCQPTLVKMPDGFRFADLAIGNSHCIALCRERRSVYVWGSNLRGQCGLGSRVQYTIAPRPIKSPKGMTEGILDIAAGNSFSLFVSEHGVLYTCGSNEWGAMLAPEHVDGYLTPQAHNANCFGIVTAVYAGGSSCFGLTKSGGCYAWGRNKDSKLGVGTTAGAEFDPICQAVRMEDPGVSEFSRLNAWEVW